MVRRVLDRCRLRVKVRRTRCEHMFSALPSNPDMARRSRAVSNGPQPDTTTAPNIHAPPHHVPSTYGQMCYYHQSCSAGRAEVSVERAARCRRQACSQEAGYLFRPRVTNHIPYVFALALRRATSALETQGRHIMNRLTTLTLTTMALL
jgi:hypothetical protein